MSVIDPLIVDLFAEDVERDLAGIIAAGPPWHGAMLKATQGNYYHAPEWFAKFWAMARDTPRYGQDWFRTAYHYVDVLVDAPAQASFFLMEIDRAGGWGPGDIYPCVDVEAANQGHDVTPSQVEDCVTEWVELVKAATGRDVVLYGGSYLRDLGIASHLGCSMIWVADYDGVLNPRKYTSLGFTVHELFAWQYAAANGDGTETALLLGYPHTTPEGNADVSAVTIDGGGVEALARMRQDAARFAPPTTT